MILLFEPYDLVSYPLLFLNQVLKNWSAREVKDEAWTFMFLYCFHIFQDHELVVAC